jgi:hypothetical protein
MDDLMTLDKIAEFYHCSSRHARDIIVRSTGFPEEAAGSSPRNRLWVTEEIRAYACRKYTKSTHTVSQPA